MRPLSITALLLSSLFTGELNTFQEEQEKDRQFTSRRLQQERYNDFCVDDLPPGNPFTCQELVEQNQCKYLQEGYCQKSCSKCEHVPDFCADDLPPGNPFTCQELADNNLCKQLEKGYCQKSCAKCFQEKGDVAPDGGFLLPSSSDFPSPLAYFPLIGGSVNSCPNSLIQGINRGAEWVHDDFFNTTVVYCRQQDGDAILLDPVPYGETTGNFAINLWIRKPTNYATNEGDKFQYIYSHTSQQKADDFSNLGNSIQIYLPEEDHELFGVLRVIVKDSDDIQKLTFLDSDGMYTDNSPRNFKLNHKRVTDGQWHMLTVTTEPDLAPGYSIFVDGVLVAKVPRNNSLDVVDGGSPLFLNGPIHLCGRVDDDADRFYDGYLTQLSLFDTFLTAEQVGALYDVVMNNAGEVELLQQLFGSEESTQVNCNDATSLQCDGDALLALKNSLTGGAYLLSNWSGNNPCNWKYIECSTVDGENVRVTQIDMNFENTNEEGAMEGDLPPQLSNLRYIDMINIGGVSLKGKLYEEFSVFSQMKSFRISNANITGTLPAEYSVWSLLLTYFTFANKLTGIIPVEYSTFSSLSKLDIAINDLSGTLPPEFSVWINLDGFAISSNYLSSTLPVEYSKWAACCYYFYIWNNRLSGMLPPQYSTMNIERASFQLNMFTGSLPAEYSQWTSCCDNFYVNNNHLTGTFPTQYSIMTLMKNIQINDNQISGPLPEQLSTWKQITFFDFSDNVFTGTLPQQFSIMKNMEEFSVHKNRLNGTFPLQYSTMTFMNKIQIGYHSDNNNKFSGLLPQQLSLWQNITYLDFSNNMFTGNLPEQFSTIRKMQNLYVDSNELNGTLPVQYSTMQNLESLVVDDNHFNGNLPIQYSTMGKLTRIWISSNDLSGTLPVQYSTMQILENFWARSNYLSGTLPVQYSTMQNLWQFYLSGNNLTQNIPLQWSTLGDANIEF